MEPARRLSACVGLILAAGAVAFPKLPAVDRHGDPLPPGAVGRLGTAQLRAGVAALDFSADGRTLVGLTADRVARVWDAADGRFLAAGQFAVGPGRVVPARWCQSPDGRTLACRRGDSVELFDVPSGAKIAVRSPSGRKQIEHLAVSDDGRRLFLSDQVGLREPPPGLGGGLPVPTYQLVLWDTTAGTARVLADDAGIVIRVALSPDGKRAVLLGIGVTRVWETATGKLLWQAEYRGEPCRFTPDRKHLIVGPGGGTEWRIWEADTGKPSKTLHPPTVGYAWMFAVSPDGNSLLIPTETDYVLWDLKAGEVRHRWPGANQSGRGTFAPDGRSVVTYDTILRRWDLATGKNLYADVSPLGHTAPVRRLFFNPDGTRLTSVGEDGTARVWDVATSKPLRSIRIEAPAIDAWAVTPDGGSLIGVDERLVVHRWPLGTDGPRVTADLRDARQLGIGLRASDIRPGPDGALTLLGYPRSSDYALKRFSFSSWNMATGRLVRWGGDPGQNFDGSYARLSADGRLAGTTEAVFDTRTGAGHALPASPFGIGAVSVFSPDGRLMAAGGVRVWEVATGRVLTDLPRRSEASDVATFSPDGRWLACVRGDQLTVWELGTRTAAAEWSMPSASGVVAFSPDGRRIATGHADGTILLWWVPPRAGVDGWSAGDGAVLWEDLGDETPGNAWPAVWEFADHPADAVRLLRGKYPLAPAAVADEFGRFIARLDSPKFAEREAASKRLAELGRAAERPLRQALKASPSPEQTKRIESLLASLDPPSLRARGEDLRAVRAVAVLEACATEEARRLLAEWAERGPPRLSDEAARAVERSRCRPVKP